MAHAERSSIVTSWRNGSASDSRSEGCVFKSRRGQDFFLVFSFCFGPSIEFSVVQIEVYYYVKQCMINT